MKRRCKCGCKRFTVWREEYKKYNIYIVGHNDKRMTILNRVKVRRRCKCGCEGLTRWNEFRRDYNEYINHHEKRNKKQSKETLMKKSQSLKNWHENNAHWGIGKKRSKESTMRLIKALTGKKRPQWVKDKISRGNKGKKRTAEVCKQNSIRNSLERHPQWLGGKSFEPYGMDFDRELKSLIRKRDKYTCRLCNVKQINKKFHIHHIDYDKRNNNPDNLITLCNSCHMKTNHNREKWKIVLTKMILQKFYVIQTRKECA